MRKLSGGHGISASDSVCLYELTLSLVGSAHRGRSFRDLGVPSRRGSDFEKDIGDIVYPVADGDRREIRSKLFIWTLRTFLDRPVDVDRCYRRCALPGVDAR